MISQVRLKELLNYNPDTGAFTWTGVSQPVGKPAGSFCSKRKYGDTRYRRISVDGTVYLEHRLAYLYMTGKFPPNQIDHVNHRCDDNRWSNLRPVTSKENHNNRTNNVKVKGVYVRNNPRQKGEWWQAQGDTINGKYKYLGIFNNYKQACFKRWQWELQHLTNKGG